MMIRRWTQVTAEKQHLAGMIELPTGVLLGLKQAVTAKKTNPPADDPNPSAIL